MAKDTNELTILQADLPKNMTEEMFDEILNKFQNQVVVKKAKLEAEGDGGNVWWGI